MNFLGLHVSLQLWPGREATPCLGNSPSLTEDPTPTSSGQWLRGGIPRRPRSATSHPASGSPLSQHEDGGHLTRGHGLQCPRWCWLPSLGLRPHRRAANRHHWTGIAFPARCAPRPWPSARLPPIAALHTLLLSSDVGAQKRGVPRLPRPHCPSGPARLSHLPPGRQALESGASVIRAGPSPERRVPGRGIGGSSGSGTC